MERVDTVVVGSGFGGLSAALHLAQAGRSVVLCEALAYPGGCASTFEKGGVTYPSGATLLAGFGPGQWMRTWLDSFELDVQVQRVEPAFVMHGPHTVDIGADRPAVVDAFCAMPGAPREAVRRWFAYQHAIADVLWGVLDEPDLLPPLSLGAVMRHVPRIGGYLRLLRLVNRPLSHALERFGVADFAPLRAFVDAACQITVQGAAHEVEAPFGIGAVDTFFRGVAHIEGGPGRLAWACTQAIERMGGEVRLASRVKQVERTGEGWVVHTRTGAVCAQNVVMNTLPADTATLTGLDSMRLRRLDTQVRSGWGAAMLYLQLEDVGLPEHAVHHELVYDSDAPLPGGNHVLVSIGARGEGGVAPGRRMASASTHVDPSSADPAATADAAHAAMRRTIAHHLPNVHIVDAFTASPRTFQRFTRRTGGFVGGVPRRVGWHNYTGLFPRPIAPGLWLVGDSVFPGQSVLATAIGGSRVASAITR